MQDTTGGQISGGILALLVVLAALASGGCSIRNFAIDRIGDALAEGGSSFAADEDPELIRAAAPFSLKLMESLLAESPRHAGLLASASRGFTQYAYAFVQQDADRLEARDVNAARAMHVRARSLYLRARDYGLRALEVAQPGFGTRLRANPDAALAPLARDHAETLYWTTVSWAAAISLAKSEPRALANLRLVDRMVERLRALDADLDYGALDGFLIAYEMGRPAAAQPERRAREHFARAVRLSGGGKAAPYLALAENVSVRNQDKDEFRSLLERALAIDGAARPEWRLENAVMQRRARWLLGRTDELFLE